MSFLAGMFGAAALGAAAATTQGLELPRMRGTATAAFFLGTTLVGLSFGPYMVGQISDMAGTIVHCKPDGDLRTGILALIGVARWEERRVGEVGVRSCRYRWSRCH